MQDLNLPLDRLKSLVLAADIRFGPTDYINDHIWEITRSSGDPPGLVLRTTYGLRARSFRLFPQFIEDNRRLTEPRDFETQPIVQTAYANYGIVEFAPFTGINVTWEIWVPDSHALAFRFTILNAGVTTRNIHMDLVALLSPGAEGHRMVAATIQGTNVLVGETAGLHPLVLQTGGSQVSEGPLPAFSFDMSLLPGTYYQSVSATAALSSTEASFARVREITAAPWEAEIARIELANADHVHIQTGNKEWDQVFALAQQTADRLLFSPQGSLPHVSFVLARQPDQGYSPRGDGTDYTHLWNGQTPLQALYLSSYLLPGRTREYEGILRNFLAVQNPDNGFIDWKPGFSGNRSLLLATPVIAWMVWDLYQYHRDPHLLEETHQALLEFVQAWFSLRQDQDSDGIPELDHPAQIGYEEHPLFSLSQPNAVGADISALESPALCAFLYQECRALINIAETIDRPEIIPALAAFAENVRAATVASWDDTRRLYRFWDRDTHQTPSGELLGQREGNGAIPIRQIFNSPARLVAHLDVEAGTTPRPQITLYGKDLHGNPVERILLPERWQWFLDSGSVTTNDLYAAIDSLKVQGLEENDLLRVYAYDFQAEDLSLMFPIFARLSTPNQARECIEKTITNPEKFWKPFGIPAIPDRPGMSHPEFEQQVLPLWNYLAGLALIQYGYRARAAELVGHLMNGILQAFQQSGTFSERYQAVEGRGSGEPNTLDGLPPVGLFLKALGVKIISPWKVLLEGQNPYAWPVRLHYRGLTVDRRNDKTIVTFPDGQAVVVEDPAPCIVTAEA
jgi:hypothetical protein